ncbi:unnamed protein product [Malassezia sympodialis ATCC 42132]|uniref:uncharacterized protein n=1 Tax=Malassezia sympodialis (strain ATCC 42132) TaxID=1230383 RepID=UPI0002C2706F|nr:uncharacterized protein MSY001_0094 [Malassezia sympodialis ATCC 42132]CCU97388.1 unnamed protein product [Malassezia sympodialis ATCC 42132]|eukprot:XP_018738740.1 uncharacterized protein MSY001_0094 [Malassezia sympodialis ATCC 42132]
MSAAPKSHYAPPPAQQRAAPQPQQAAPVASQGPGLFGQTVGHGISNMLFGGRSYEAAPPPQQVDSFSEQNTGINCDVQSKDFITCLEKTNDMNACAYYLEQLKACQAAARGH